MNTLSYSALRASGYQGYVLEDAPVRVLQFGEGNFLRAFVDYWFDLANERAGFNGKCMLVQPIKDGLSDIINRQEGLYTLYLRGTESGETVDKKRVISSVKGCLNPYVKSDFDQMMRVAELDTLEYVVSNTTEAGIVFDSSCKFDDAPASSFPGKLTQVLYTRYKAGKGGLAILSCELIDNNGKVLLDCVNKYIDLWGLDGGFRAYVNEECVFASTLVDRIVPGRVRDAEMLAKMEEDNGYHDDLIVVGEVFGVWNIEGDEALSEKLPFARAGVDNCTVVPDVTPYKKRKVRILNGAHTGTVLGAYLGGFDIVRDCMKNPLISGFMNKMLTEEILPLLPAECKNSREFAEAVKDRFNNPFIDHSLLSISLNSVSKWRARNMPSFLEYTEKNGKLPVCLTMSLAALIAFYSSGLTSLDGEGLHATRQNGEEYVCKDDAWVLETFYALKDKKAEELVPAILSDERMWGADLNKIDGLTELILKYYKRISSAGALSALGSCIYGV